MGYRRWSGDQTAAFANVAVGLRALDARPTVAKMEYHSDKMIIAP